MGDTEDGTGRVYVMLDRFDEEHFSEIVQLIDQLPKIVNDDDQSRIARERFLERCIYILDQYQEQPHLLDPKIPHFIDRLIEFVRPAGSDSDRRLVFQAFQLLRVLIKVRGYKTFAHFLPHEHSDLIPVLRMLEELLRAEANVETAADICISEYVLLIWLSMLCKIPFDFSRFDASSGGTPGITKSTSQRIYDVVLPCLITKDQRREAAAFCLSVFVARPDSVRQYLRSLIFDDILTLFADADKHYGNLQAQYGINADFIISARCILLAGLLKRVKREEITHEWAKAILEKVFSFPAILSDSSNILIRKLTTKIVVRSALTMLKPRIASWRYERGSRSLEANLTSPEPARETGDVSTTSSNAELDDDFEIPGDIESVINYLLIALKDKDTVCRWSAAKGFGRLCARLPRALADQIVSAILAFFNDDFADASRHGACLALAELGRRGLLLPSRLEEVVPLIVCALTYDEQRGTYSVGSNVRDAACYVCWSFARAYAPAELRPYNLQLAIGLLTTAVYDREVNCRRAASAAFQEHVGRQRGEFPHGIDLLTAADYFAVRNLKHCYRDLSVFVASFSEYTRPMIDHLLDQKVSHWDEHIRELAGDALRNLSAVDQDYVATSVIPKLMEITNGYELFACHGTVIALGRSASILHSRLSPTDTTQLFELPQHILDSQFFKGLGGELMRKALNDYIFNICLFIKGKVGDAESMRRYSLVYRAILDDNLTHQRDDIRLGARKASEALFAAVPPSTVKIIDDYILQMGKAIYEKQRMGACFALSSLPRAVLVEYRTKILEALMQYSILSDKKQAPDSSWASARRDALSSLSTVVDKLGVDNEDSLSANELESIIDCYAKALDDYTTDSRGDIGSYVRESAISGLKSVFGRLLSSTSGHVILNADLSKRVVKKVLQQCCEKIDRTRDLAYDCMKTLIKEARTPERLVSILHVPRADILMDIFKEDIDWTNANKAYPRLIKLLDAGDEYAYPVLLGFAVTVGGMTESTVRASSDALLAYLGKMQNDQNLLRLIIKTLISIFDDHRKLDRVNLPLMKMIDQILSCNYLDDFLQSDGDSAALENLLDLCIAETKLSKNSQKVLIGLAVCNCFLRFEGTAVARKALKYAIAMLTHPYPRIRREAANRLYESLLSYLVLDNHSEQALTILSETDWDAEPTDLKESQTELERLLKVV